MARSAVVAWWRSWHGFPLQLKLCTVADKADVSPAVVAGVLWALWDTASQAENRGDITGFDVDGYAYWAKMEQGKIQAVIDALTDKGFVKNGRMAEWDFRQPKREDPTNAERQSRHRARTTARAAEGSQSTQQWNNVGSYADYIERGGVNMEADADSGVT